MNPPFLLLKSTHFDPFAARRLVIATSQESDRQAWLVGTENGERGTEELLEMYLLVILNKASENSHV